MFNNINFDFDNFIKTLKDKNYKNEFTYLLQNSMFYYCCGKDPTPILALNKEYPLFVYADIVDYGRGDFGQTTEKLYDRLKKKKLTLKKIENFNFDESFKNSTLSLWEGENSSFLLLYVQGDATKIFKYIYNNNHKIICPKCICNIKYEMNTSYFLQIEKEISFILGYCYSENFSKINEFNYYGDYNVLNKKVYLYKNLYFDEKIF